MPDTPAAYVYRIELNRRGESMTPRHMHKALMSALPGGLDQHGPRRDAGLLWHRQGRQLFISVRGDLDVVLPVSVGQIITRTSVDELLDHAESQQGMSDRVRMSVTMTRQRSRSVRGAISQDMRDVLSAQGVEWKKKSRGVLVTVAEHDLRDWLEDLATRRWGGCSDIDITHVGHHQLGRTDARGDGVPVVTVEITVDKATARELMTVGVGKARNYGVGWGLPVTGSL